MKVLLMHRDRDFAVDQAPSSGARDFLPDLELDVLLAAMAAGDQFLLEVARTAVLAAPTDVPTVLYRQGVLRDCIDNAAIVRDLYDLAVNAIERERKQYWGIHSYSPGFLLHRSVEVLSMLVEALRTLRRAAEAPAGEFGSDGFRTLFAMLREELDDSYLGTVEAHLERLRFRRGVLLSAGLGKGLLGVGHRLRKPNGDDRPWLRRLLPPRRAAYTFHIAERDEAGARAVTELRDRGINIAANAAAQSCDHILGFFRTLRAELAFYIGCLNLRERLSAKGEPICFPSPAGRAERRFIARGLYDPSLALTLDYRVIGNDVDGDGRDLFVITGANQGGKSTLLRSIGLAQLMMQCGMFVPARSYRGSLSAGLFTHFKRDEDPTMRSGKFEEELERMSSIADRLSPDCIVLFNESFQSTNEREGAEIARHIIRALLEAGLRVFFVTHMHDLAGRLYEEKIERALFLRAERLADGTRTFKVIPGAPLQTSYGADLYQQTFAAPVDGMADPIIASAGGCHDD